MEFFEEMLIDKETTEKLIILKNDVAYLSDIFFMLNESNKQLQGNNMTMVKCHNVITSFINKLELYKSNVSRCELRQSPNFIQKQVSTKKPLRYSGHLQNLRRDYVERFADVINLEIPEWNICPCSCHLQQVPIELQESLIDLLSDDVVKSSFPEQ